MNILVFVGLRALALAVGLLVALPLISVMGGGLYEELRRGRLEQPHRIRLTQV